MLWKTLLYDCQAFTDVVECQSRDDITLTLITPVTPVTHTHTGPTLESVMLNLTVKTSFILRPGDSNMISL